MTQLKSEIWRKSVHISGIFFLPILFRSRDLFVFLLLVFLVCYLLVELAQKKGIRVPLLTALTRKSKRPHEDKKLAKGPILLVIAGVTTPYLFGVEAAAIGLTQVFLADAASTFAGMTWGKKRLPYSKGKSWVGTVVFFLIALATTLYFTPLPQALLLALAGALIESLPIYDVDNLTVPLGVSLLASLI